MPIFGRNRFSPSPNSFHAARTRCIIEKYKLPMFLDLLHKTSAGAITPGAQPRSIAESDLLTIAQQQRVVAHTSRQFQRRTELVLALDMSASHWRLPAVQVCLGLASTHSDLQVEVNERFVGNFHTASLSNIPIPVAQDLSGGKSVIRANHEPPAVRQHAVCLSYVQTPDGDIPSAAAADWDWLNLRLRAAGAAEGIWCDKLPLAGGAGWWARKAPLLYATQPVLISPPLKVDGYGHKLDPRDTTEGLFHGALQSSEGHIRSCSRCRHEFRVLLKSLVAVIVGAADGHPSRGWAGDLLKQCDTDVVVETLLEAEMAPPGWRIRLWPRMEATVALQSRGAVMSPRGFYAVAKLVLMQSFVTAWALMEYGSLDDGPVKQADGLIGMVKFWQPALHVFRECWGEGRFDKGIWGAVMEEFGSESSSYERALVTRALATDGNCLSVQYALQFLSKQESLNHANVWVGEGELFRAVNDSIGPLSLRVTVMELLRVPVGARDVFDPADIILWKREVNCLKLPHPDAAPELVLVDDTRRYCLGIKPYDHCAFGEYSGPHLELAWSRHCSQEMVIASVEAWRMNREVLAKADFVGNYYRAELDMPSFTAAASAISAAQESGPVCADHAHMNYQKVGFSVGWQCVDPSNREGGVKLWFCSVNEELKTAHLDCIMWVHENRSVGGADDPLYVQSSTTSTPSEWHESRGDRCCQCDTALGTWAVFLGGAGTSVAAYSCGIGALPVWLPNRLR